MSKSQILSDDKRHLAIFENGVVINKSLPKWKNAEQNISARAKNDSIKFSDLSINTYNLSTLPSHDDDVDGNINASTPTELYKIHDGTIDTFSEVATMGIRELNKLIVETKMKYVMAGYGSFGTTVTLSNYASNDFGEKKSDTVRKLDFKSIFTKKKNKPMDALKFFSLIKATSKEAANKYKNRIEQYLCALHKAISIGQTALSEDLLRGLITNQYEAQLYAEGYYYAVTEEQAVKFLKKTEKGIKLSYIKNFSRPIPDDAADKISILNALEIFDNYVVLYYDPEGEAFKETAQENAKRRDPILFGLIAGSRKLYYIADWTDEYCDLTLEAFVDTLGIDKEKLNIDNAK